MDPINIRTLDLLEQRVPPLGQQWAALHFVRHHDIDEAILYGHLVAQRLETIEENCKQLNAMLQQLLS